MCRSAREGWDGNSTPLIFCLVPHSSALAVNCRCESHSIEITWKFRSSKLTSYRRRYARGSLPYMGRRRRRWWWWGRRFRRSERRKGRKGGGIIPETEIRDNGSAARHSKKLTHTSSPSLLVLIIGASVASTSRASRSCLFKIFDLSKPPPPPRGTTRHSNKSAESMMTEVSEVSKTKSRILVR